MKCPFSDGNSCMQYNAMKEFCQHCPIMFPGLVNTPDRKATLLTFHGFIALKCGKENSCSGKIRYTHFARAMEATEEVKRRGDNKEPYPCPWCHGWHIGRRMSPQELQRFM
jgi:Fe-S-cluster containining protein